MTSKFAPNRTIPDGFDEELRFFTRECLRSWSQVQAEGSNVADSQKWILAYAKQYFEDGGRAAILSRRRDLEPAQPAATAFPTAEELEAKIRAIFLEADKDGNGILDRKEFKRVMKLFAQELNLKVQDLRQLMLLSDENDDGIIEYHEFVPLALELLQMIYAKLRHAEQQAARQSKAAEESTAFLLNGLTREELEAALGDIFRAADSDGSGHLDRKEFMSALTNSELGLTKKQVKYLWEAADEDASDSITYNEFVPLAFGLLSEMVARQMEYEQLPHDESAAMEYLTQLFAEYDVSGEGKIHLSTLQQAFRDSDIGLSRLQLRALLGEAKVDDAGEVDYRAFAKASSSMIAAILSIQMDSDKAAKVVAARAGASALAVLGMDRPTFKDTLASALHATDAAQTGRTTLADIRDALTSQLGWDEHSVGAILNLAREGGVDEEGKVDIVFTVEFAFDTLAQMAQLEALATY